MCVCIVDHWLTLQCVYVYIYICVVFAYTFTHIKIKSVGINGLSAFNAQIMLADWPRFWARVLQNHYL